MSAMKIIFKLPSAAKYYVNRLKLIYRTCLISSLVIGLLVAGFGHSSTTPLSF